MWEEVEGLDLFDGVAGFIELYKVAHLGGRVTGDVDNAAGAELSQLVEESFGAALAGRVDDEGGPVSIKAEVVEDSFCRGGEDFDVGEVIEGGVAAGKVSGRFGDLYSGDFLELAGKREGKES